MATMSPQERVLYHRLHPFKVAVDGTCAGLSTLLFWHHELVLAIVLGVVPAAVTSLAMVRYMDFPAERDSPAGRYLAFHAGPASDVVRLAGGLVAWGAAWGHRPLGVAVGVGIVAAGWTWSLPRWLRRA